MLPRLLSYLGLILIDDDAIARRLAQDIIRLWGSDINMLAESTAKRDMQRKYMEMAMAIGLPGEISKQVANKAWKYVAQAQERPVVDTKGFSFYG